MPWRWVGALSLLFTLFFACIDKLSIAKIHILEVQIHKYEIPKKLRELPVDLSHGIHQAVFGISYHVVTGLARLAWSGSVTKRGWTLCRS
jgi:hypothetical protein